MTNHTRSNPIAWDKLPMALQLIRRRPMEGTETAALPRLLLLVAWQARIDADKGCPEASGWLDEMLPDVSRWLHKYG